MLTRRDVEKFVEALEILGLGFRVEGNCVFVDRDTMVAAFPRVLESDVYRLVYNEISEYCGAGFYWAKADDDFFVASFREV